MTNTAAPERSTGALPTLATPADGRHVWRAALPRDAGGDDAAPQIHRVLARRIAVQTSIV